MPERGLIPGVSSSGKPYREEFRKLSFQGIMPAFMDPLNTGKVWHIPNIRFRESAH